MKQVLITGGTGSFGKAFLEEILDSGYSLERVVVYSRDELKQWEIQQRFPVNKYPQLRLFLGDVRDKERLIQAMQGIDTVIHAAALKQVPAAEYNPLEFIKTNVLGTENVVQACLANNVKNAVALSTDKAAAPVNLYGATKLCADKLFIAANNIKGKRDIKFSVVRYGNVMGSRGSVTPFFLNQARNGSFISVTDERMTRFNISLKQGVKMVLWALRNQIGKELFVPKIPSYNILELAKAIAPSLQTQVIGIRPGEKIHEEMITVSDSPTTVDIGDYYAILPPGDNFELQTYIDVWKARLVPENFSYSSGSNPHFLNAEQLRDLIRENVDPNFQPI